MKLKYFIRGLGIGILVTALIFIAFIIPQKKMTDEQIKEAAVRLGMVDAKEDSSLLDLLNPTKEQEQIVSTTGTGSESSFPTETSEPDTIKTDTENTEPGIDNTETGMENTKPGIENTEPGIENTKPGIDNTEPGIENTEPGMSESRSTPLEPETATEASKESTKAAESETTGEQSELVRVKITSGMNSEMFSAILLEAGLINDAELFNQFLIRKGYSYRLIVGIYEIPMGSTHEEIAKIVTQRVYQRNERN